MRFAILGPVRAWLGETELDLGPPTQRALLALLLVNAGQPVALTEIVDVLWDEDPPRTAVNIIHRHVGALRRLTEPGLPARATGHLLLPSSGGYRLNVDTGMLDLLEFRELHRRARAATDPGLFAEALALWRGPVAAGVPATVRAHPSFVAVDREYLAAVREAADAALEAGSLDRILPVLRQAAHEHPLDEALQARLVLALAATGHQAGALDAYQTVRDRLVGELGIDPGPELRAAHAQVLQPRTETRPSQAAPTQLPADLPNFSGRDNELTRTSQLLAETAMTTIAIFGMAGVGKTTLAVHFAHTVAGRFPDGQLYVHLRGFDPNSTVTSSEAVRGFLEALGVAPHRMPADLDAQTALYRSLLAGRRVLVLVDDARDADHVRPLLPGTPGCMVVITSRTQLLGLVARNGAHPLALGLPTIDEAREIFVRRLGASRVDAEAAAVDEIIGRCGRLPLALAIVAARAATPPAFPLVSIAAELRGDLGAFDDTDPDIDVRTVFSWSYQAVTPGAARLFRLLALHPGPDISGEAAADLAGEPVSAQLDDLVHAHLINENLPGRYAFHDLLRAYAVELTEAEDRLADRRAARSRLLDHYLGRASAATGLLYPYRDLPLAETTVDFADNQKAEAWLRAERPAMLPVTAMAAENGFERHAWQLAAAVELFFDRDGRWQEQITLQGIALTSAQRQDSPSAAAHAHRARGFAHGRLHQTEEAARHLEQALELFGDLGDHSGQSWTHRYMAFLANMRTNHHRALRHYEQAQEHLRATGYQPGQASVYNEVGWTLILLGDYQGALEQCRRAVELQKAVGNRSGEAASSDSLGYAYHHLGKDDLALQWYGRALRLYRETKDRYLEADTLVHIGESENARNRQAEAAHAWQQALVILDELGHPEADSVRGRLSAGQ
ncbi:MAG: BTAD domain-containing putative transcriptional regulator [Kibdelosporangium sp.]